MDVLTVLIPCSDGVHYSVWSEQWERIIYMTAEDIAQCEAQGEDEIVWECCACI